MRRSLAVTALAAALALVASSTAVADSPNEKLIVETHSVPPGGPHAVVVRCPPGWVAAQGVLTAGDSGIIPVETFASAAGPREWEFDYDNTAAGPLHVTVQVRCIDTSDVKTSGPLTESVQKSVTLGAGETKKLVAKCPKNFLAIGWGDTRASGALLRVSALFFVTRTFTILVTNLGTDDAVYKAQVECIREQFKENGEARVFETNEVSKSPVVHPNETQRVNLKCRAPLSGEFKVLPDEVFVFPGTDKSAGATAHKQPVQVTNLDKTDHKVPVGLNCLESHKR